MIRLAVRIGPDADRELVLAELLEFAPLGVEEVEEEGFIEYAIYGVPGELPDLPALQAAVGGVLVDVVANEVPDDWESRWKSFHRPVIVADRLYVRPPWEQAYDDSVIDLVIDPGQAFGTGSHPTTRLCLELMLDHLEPAGSLLDLGCGSGVLAIAAAKLGWESVSALDFDPLAVAATRANALANGVRIDTQLYDLRRSSPPAADTVVANLLRPLLLDLSGSLKVPPSRLIVSGLLSEEADEVVARFELLGLKEIARRYLADWSAVLLVDSVNFSSLAT